MAARPLAGTEGGWVRGVETADPVAHLDPHRGLGVSCSLVGKGVVVGQRADGVVVDGPDDALGGPVDRVRVVGIDGGGDGYGRAAIVGGSIALSEEVGLDVGVV